LETKYLGVLCAGSTLPLAKQSLDEAPYKLSRAIAKLAGITFGRLAFSYWIDNLGFLLREKLAAIFIKPFSWGFQLAGHLLHRLHANNFSGTIHHRAIRGHGLALGCAALLCGPLMAPLRLLFGSLEASVNF
jgi:hypothetical protein